MKYRLYLGSQDYVDTEGHRRSIVLFRRENGDFQASVVLLGATAWKATRVEAVEDAVAMIEARIAHEAKGSTR